MGYTASRILVWAVVSAMVFALIPADQLAATGNEQDCTLHEPIRILEDHGDFGFTWDDPVTGEQVYRPGSGVVAGDGTASNPYVIEGWCISGSMYDPGFVATDMCGFGFDGPQPENTGVIICGTSAHFVFQNNTVNLWKHGTGVGNVSSDSGAIEHTSHQNNTYQIHLNDAPGLEIRDNVIHGIDTTEMVLISERGIRGSSPNVTIADNTLVGAGALVDLTGDGLRIADNDFDSSGDGHVEAGGDELEIVGNHMENTIFDGPPRWPIYFYGDDALVADNHVDGYDWFGIWHRGGTGAEIAGNYLTGSSTGIYATSDALIHNTTVEGGHEGIDLDSDAAGARVENVTVTGAAEGLEAGGDGSTWTHVDVSGYSEVGMLVDGGNLTVRQTNFADTNGTALNATDATTTVDARHNWWGCADGPDDPACDDVVGEAVYEPWLEAPNQDAGKTT